MNATIILINKKKHTRRNRLLSLVIFFILILNINTTYIADAQEVKKRNEKAIMKNNLMKQEENYLEGIKYYHLEKYEKAIEYIKKAITNDNNDHEVYYLMSKCFFRIKKYEKAINNVQKAINIEKKQVFYYILLANIYEELNDFKGLTETLLHIIKNCDVDKRVYWLKLANVYEATSDYNSALKCVDNILKSTGNIWAFTLKKINLLDKSNKALKGNECLADFLKQNPYHFNALLFQAKRQLENNKIKDAQKTVKKAYKISKHNAELLKVASALDRKKGNVQWKEGENLPLPVKLDRVKQTIKNKDYEMAKKQLEALKNKHASNTDILFLLGKVSYLADNHADTISYLEKVVQEDIENLDALVILWKTYIKIKATDKLIKSTIDTLELYPNQSKVYLYCGEGYWLKKNNVKAIEYWEKGIKMAVKSPIGEELSKKLKMAKEKN